MMCNFDLVILLIHAHDTLLFMTCCHLLYLALTVAHLLGMVHGEMSLPMRCSLCCHDLNAIP